MTTISFFFGVQSTCTEGGKPNVCCKESGKVYSKCDDMDGDWRKNEAKKFMSNAESDDCCDDCILPKDTDAYKSCTAKNYVTATVCGTNGKEDDERVYKPGPPIAFKTDCSTGPTHTVRCCLECVVGVVLEWWLALFLRPLILIILACSPFFLSLSLSRSHSRHVSPRTGNWSRRRGSRR